MSDSRSTRNNVYYLGHVKPLYDDDSSGADPSSVLGAEGRGAENETPQASSGVREKKEGGGSPPSPDY